MPSNVMAAAPDAIAPPAAPVQSARRRVAPLRGGPEPMSALLRAFWSVSALLLLVVAIKTPQLAVDSLVGALLIILAAMWPTYLWVSGKVRGLPLFPAFALTSIWHYAIPLLFRSPWIMMFPSASHLTAALSVTGFLLVGTAVWYPIARRPPRPPVTCWMMNERQALPLLYVALVLCLLWNLVYSSGLIPVPASLISGMKIALIVVETVSIFVLGYQLGCGALKPEQRYAFYGLLLALILFTLPSLLLYVAVSLALTSMIAYTIASKRLPWRVAVVAILVVSFLQAGKSEMRDRYMQQDEPTDITLSMYPRVMAEWTVASVQAIRNGSEEDNVTDESLIHRDTLMEWLLYFEWFSPNQVPFLHGETYAAIPRVFVPRFLDPDKPKGNEGSFILAIAYGIQTRETIDFVTFAFGLLNESYANFGYLGIGGLAVVLGAFYGWVARWSRQMPILSFRALFAFLIASLAVQAESTSTFLVGSLFQSAVILLALSAIFMRRQRLNQLPASRLE